MFYFCTYFDSNFLSRGLALYRSLVRHAAPFHLWVLCFDDLAYETLRRLALSEVTPISLGDFEEGDQELVQTKKGRSRVEYYFTCTPSLPLYVLRHWPEVEVITYLDADLFFFADPSPIYEELGGNAILIGEHRYPEHLRHLESVGVYNVGLLSFSRDDNGLKCLNWWRRRCIEWCYDREENGRYADQKYLDDWPERFSGVVILQHKGAGLAPWNVVNYNLGLENGQILVDAQPLVFFHFHGFKQVSRWVYDPNLARYGVRSNDLLKRYIYKSYARELYEVGRWLHSVSDRWDIHEGSIRGDNPWKVGGNSIFQPLMKRIYHRLYLIKNVCQGKLWIVKGGNIL